MGGDCLPICTTSPLDCNQTQGGVCVTSAGTALCICATGYTGSDCHACDTGYQDNDHDGRCAPTCANTALSCGGNQVCDDASGTAACTDYPSTCASAVSSQSGAAPDSGYTLYFHNNPGAPWQANCVPTDAGVLEYLVLPAQAMSQNFSEYTAGGPWVSGTSIVTRYQEVRIDPVTFVVDSSDARFATTNSDGQIASNDGHWTLTGPLDWGTAQNCDSSGNPGAGDINLTGTPFVLAGSESFVPQGTVAQTVLISPSRQTLDLNVEGACASVGASTAHEVQLALACANGYLAPDCASTCRPAYVATDAGTCAPAAALTTDVAEPAGSHCTYGGTIHESGLDLDGDGVLEPSEVDPSQFVYVCNPPPGYTVGGTVTGLPPGASADGGALVLNLGGESLSLTADGTFTFNTELLTGATYSVDITLNPDTRFCEPVLGTSLSGTIGTAPVTNIAIACYEFGQVITWAGSTPGAANGTGTAAQFRSPGGVTMDGNGNLYVADFYNYAIRKITPAGVVSTLVSNASGASFGQPFDVAVDRSGNLFVTDIGKHRIVKISPSGAFSTLAGDGTAGSVDGTGGNAEFHSPTSIAIDSVGNLYVVDSGNNHLRKVTPAGVVTTLTSSGFASNPGSSAALLPFTDLAVDRNDKVYATTTNHGVITVDSAGQVSVVLITYDINSMSAAPDYQNLTGIAVDPAGNLYVSDTTANFRIRKIPPNAAVVYVIGSGGGGPPPAQAVITLVSSGAAGYADGTGTAARFSAPTGVAVDAKGNVYVADLGNNRIRKVYQTLQGSSVSITSTPIVVNTSTAPDYSQLEATYDADSTAVYLLNILKGSWDATTYGTIPRDGVVFDFAQKMCQLVSGCSTPGDAMSNALTLMQGDSTYYAIVASWDPIVSSSGWGVNNPCLPGSPCTIFSSQVPAEVQQTLWKSTTAPANLINTASLLAGMLGQLQSGDPGYGTSLVDALKNLGDLNSAISRGLDSVLLLGEAESIVNLQKQGQPLTTGQQAFADALVQQIVTNDKSALATVASDFHAFEAANAPPPLMGGIYYLGTPPTQDMQNALITLLPGTSGNQQIDDTATTTARLLTAIGQSEQARTGNYVDVGAISAGLGVGVPLASAITAIGIGSIAFGGTSVFTSTTTVGASVVLGVSESAAIGTGGGGAIATAAVGPAAIVVAALVAIGSGAAIVAQVDQFNNTINLFQVYLDFYTRYPPTLADFKGQPLGLFLCTPSQEQYAIIKLLGQP